MKNKVTLLNLSKNEVMYEVYSNYSTLAAGLGSENNIQGFTVQMLRFHTYSAKTCKNGMPIIVEKTIFFQIHVY